MTREPLGTVQRTIRVYVWDKAHDISVHQRSKSVWIARGDHLGEMIEVKGRTCRASADTEQSSASEKNCSERRNRND